ncbi:MULTISPECIES: GIY-YIG nuclease family protein [Vibrio]|uniref:GIY-YIG nuclease family protein n=1 Tax=Vibrio casei TaxID=673372 RepID=A0A368LFW2_9VIBR|nr:MULTISPECIES: GIY-YIG nuclease family protein [Vibrio]RCS68335.1 GIY-YIG nuclease family protein [Vibrio casei]SJN41383.1 Excinuclease ABC, C subunit-like [Vibrio casei]HBV77420.1 GIY-YIG nuclease family protein [Vibrio sp.]
MNKQPCVYILSSLNHRSLYIGVTSQLKQRVWQHKNKQVDGFSRRYNTVLLVYYEQYSNMELAIVREKQLKKWKREWKNELIQKVNPNFTDLYFDL